MSRFINFDYAGGQASIVRSQGLLLLMIVTVAYCVGCNGSGSSLAISGEVMLDGKRVPAEIQIEQLDEEGHRVGRSTTAYADERGQFSASIERTSQSMGLLTCSLVVRVSELSSNGLPTALDENAQGAKVVRLRRSIRTSEPFSLLLTR